MTCAWLGAGNGVSFGSLLGTPTVARSGFCEPPDALQKIPKSNTRSGSSPAMDFALSTYSFALGDIAAHCSSVGKVGAPPRPPPGACAVSTVVAITHAQRPAKIIFIITVLRPDPRSPRSPLPDPRSPPPDPRSPSPDPRSPIPDPDPRSPIPDP